ncbi:glycoside hydrolase family 19 protein [Palleronia caenipelagi]|uniref:Glycoside hydrolase family 19 protein n=1 Tax=Palleronia caenipelagi TaxID=2489174 RepID=A0A547PSF2_9RHOB|nr:glycoside hydrolase family 19 protein [Palleronia caenipelagi]TRD16984.1 glycoside hydrolase family 19 protein [Palleronia caenipelagi]
MQIDAAFLAAIRRSKPPAHNTGPVLAALTAHAVDMGLRKPHRLAHFLSQLAHESQGFIYDQEIWGPTAAQRRYEGRLDLGNTQPGDGKRFKGRGPIQITGRGNYRRFTLWCSALNPLAPDFERDPDAVNSDPWEGLTAIWYWDTGNPTGRSLNRYADDNDIEMITRRINGGLNGYEDRLECYDRTALLMLGFRAEDVIGFQRHAGIRADGLSGPQTRGALHAALLNAPDVIFAGETASESDLDLIARLRADLAQMAEQLAHIRATLEDAA